jgi:hypothetical protein
MNLEFRYEVYADWFFGYADFILFLTKMKGPRPANKLCMMNYTPEMIRQQLADSSRALADLTASMVYDDPSLLKPLLEVAYQDVDPWSQRASRVVSICSLAYPDMVKPYVSQIIGKMKGLQGEAPIRNFLLIFAECPVALNKKDREKLMNLAFDYLSGPYAVGIRMYSMTVLYNLSAHIPEIKPLLYQIIREQMEDASPGVRSRGNRILKQLIRE